MRIDDIQWAFNKSTGLYEMYLYELTSNHHRVTTLEMPPMQVLNLGRRFMEVVARDFPPAKPPADNPPEVAEIKTND